MNELTFRTMLIGVGVFVTVATLSAILLYYNVAVSSANAVSKRTNIELEYSKRITTLLEKDTLTGTDVRNVIRYYYLNEMVEISITKIKGKSIADMNNEKTGSGEIYRNVNNTWKAPGEIKVISEYNMERINPSYKGSIVENKKEGNKQIINIELS